jgi:hypothetical protein
MSSKSYDDNRQADYGHAIIRVWEVKSPPSEYHTTHKVSELALVLKMLEIQRSGKA